MKWAIAQGHRGDDPAGDAITEALPNGSHTTTHHPALSFAEVGAAITTVRDSGAWPATKLAFEFFDADGLPEPRSPASRVHRD